MAFEPLTRGDIGQMSTLARPGLFKSFSGRKDWALINPGDGHMVYIAGDSLGMGFAWDGAKDNIGLIIQDIIVEVDDSSSLDTNSFTLPKGALIRSKAGWGVVCDYHGSRGNEGVIMAIEGPRPENGRNSLGYACWRVCVREDRNVVPVITVTAHMSIKLF